MTKYLFVIIIAILLFQGCNEGNKGNKYGLVIHGGAGYFHKGYFSDVDEKAYQNKLSEAVEYGYKMLDNGAKAVDVVEAVITIMEDSPLFNAGKGSVFTHSRTNELDASIMDGSNKNAGAVGAVTTIKNPIKLAKAVMYNSEHVMLIGKGAEVFAGENGIEQVDSSYFWTKDKWERINSVLKEDSLKAEKHGTVGCVVKDKYGNLAAGTSTGGMTNKKFGRIGDSPIIGAGTYANNNTCAVSATGHGEFFIRNVVAHSISARMEYMGESVKDASDYIINEELLKQDGRGGVICIDKYGNIAMPFNTSGMFRAYKLSSGKSEVLLYK